MTQQEVEHACAPDTEHCSCVPHLRAEIERLRRQRVLSNEDFTCAFDRGIAEGERQATARIVAWLRGFDTDTRSASSDIRWCIRGLANYIERGEHRREGDK